MATSRCDRRGRDGLRNTIKMRQSLLPRRLVTPDGYLTRSLLNDAGDRFSRAGNVRRCQPSRKPYEVIKP
jgi:hypothetical protein